MMNQRELRAYYAEKAELRKTALTLDGLRQYQDIPEVAAEIAAMEAAVQTKTAELDAKAGEVLSTLSTVRSAYDRTVLSLRFYHGLSWEEVAAFCGMTKKTVKQYIYRTLRKTIPQ